MRDLLLAVVALVAFPARRLMASLARPMLNVAALLCGVLYLAGQARAGTMVYATADNGVASIFGTMNLATGQFTQISTTTPYFGSLTAGPGGTIYGGSGNLGYHLYTISPSGSPIIYGTVTAPSNSLGFFGLASAGAAGFFADSVALQGTTYTVSLDRISASGSTLSFVQILGPPFNTFNSGNLAFGPNGNLYFDSGFAEGDNFLYQVNTSTGVATQVGSGLLTAFPLTLVTSGSSLYGIDTFTLTDPQVYVINTTTGIASPTVSVSGLPLNYTLDTLAADSVPEPSTSILASIAGLVSLCCVWRRRKAKLTG